MIVSTVFYSHVDFFRLIPYRCATRFIFKKVCIQFSTPKFTSVSSVAPTFEARSEAWVLFTSVWHLRFSMKPCLDWVSFQRTANCGTVSCLSQDYPIIIWADSFSLSWLAQGSIACAGFGEQLGRLLSGTLAPKRTFGSLRVPRRECIDFPLAVIATHPSSGLFQTQDSKKWRM